MTESKIRPKNLEFSLTNIQSRTGVPFLFLSCSNVSLLGDGYHKPKRNYQVQASKHRFVN